MMTIAMTIVSGENIGRYHVTSQHMCHMFFDHLTVFETHVEHYGVQER